MALQINSSNTLPVAAKAEPAPKVAAPAQEVARVSTVPHADTVKLSVSARIHQLKNAGANAGQIATSLGLDAKTVAGYFNAAPVKAIATPVAAQAPQAQAVPAAPVPVKSGK